MVWYSHLFQNFPEFVVFHTIKGFGIVNKAEVDIFLELSCFFDDPVDVGCSTTWSCVNVLLILSNIVLVFSVLCISTQWTIG